MYFRLTLELAPLKVKVTFHAWEMRLGTLFSCCLPAQVISCFCITAPAGRSNVRDSCSPLPSSSWSFTVPALLLITSGLWCFKPNLQKNHRIFFHIQCRAQPHTAERAPGEKWEAEEGRRVGDLLNRTCHWQNSNVDLQAHVCPFGPWQRTGPEGPPGTMVTFAAQDIPR